VIENEKINKGGVQRRLKDIKGDAAFVDERAILQKYAALLDDEAETKSAIREAEKELERKILAKYPSLSLEGVKTLVVERKWMHALLAAIALEVDRLSLSLASRIQELAGRYALPMPAILGRIEELKIKVDGHLEKMGFVW
jgi:type I restriction enzyme M protein